MTAQPADAPLRGTPEFWDQRYDGPQWVFGERPNIFLVDQSWRLDPGSRVLVPGDGDGRNGVWLAAQGHRVLSVDFSARGLQKATTLALRRGVTIQTQCADLLGWDWPVESFDAVVSIFLHLPTQSRRSLWQRMIQALKPGGLLIIESFHPEQIGNPSGGPKDPSLMVTPEEVRGFFSGHEITVAEVWRGDLNEGGGHKGPAVTTRAVIRRMS